jgi:glycosyltransferase involved in cell wall biosynthesis
MTKDTTIISVILKVIYPIYDIKQCVERIIQQSLNSFELIVISPNLSVNSTKLFELFCDERISHVVSEADYIRSINKAIALSKGKYIMITDTNGFMHEGKLEKQFAYMEDHVEVDCCYTWVKAFGCCSFEIAYEYLQERFVSDLLFYNPLVSVSALFRKSSLEKFKLLSNLYDKKYTLAEDYALWVKLIKKGCRFGYLPEFLMDYYVPVIMVNPEIERQIFLQETCIQSQQINYVCSKIVKADESLVEVLNEYLTRYENNRINFDTLRNYLSEQYLSLNPVQSAVSKKKKLLFCIPNLNSGGAEKQLITFLEKMDYQTYEADLLILERHGVYFDEIPEPVNWYTLEYFEKHIVKKYDIEISFLEGFSTKYIANRKSAAKKIAWVRIDLFTFHWTQCFFRDLAEERNCYLKYDKIMFNSQDTLERFRDRFGEVPVEKIVRYNLIDREKIILKSNEYSVVKPAEITLCSIGRLASQKGYERLLPILKILKEEGLVFHFWIIGEGQLKPVLERLIADLSLEKQVTLCGFKKNPFPYLKNCDIFVQASLAEGFSLVVAEAICLGKPVLATSTAGPRELLDGGRFGYLVNNNEKEIVNGLRDLILDRNKREEFSKKSHQRSFMFDIERNFRDSMNVLIDDKQN